MGIVVQQGIGGHQHARSAEAALQAMLFFEALLQWMQLAVLHQAFDGEHFAAIGLHGEHGAGLDRLAIEHHGAGAAMGGVAADVCARKPRQSCG